jgi:integrase
LGRFKTWQLYDLHCRLLYLIPALGRARLSELQPQQVEALLGKLLGDGLSPATVASSRRCLGVALKHAKDLGLVARNVVGLVKAPKVPQRELTIPEAGELRRLLATVQGSQYEALFVLALHSGMRCGELFGLRWGRVDFERRLLRVTAALQRIDGKLVLGELKTPKSRRTLGLNELVLEALQRHRERQVAVNYRALGNAPDLVFTNERGLVNPTTLHHHFKRALKAAGLPDMHLRDLRHADATLMLDQGVPLKIVSDWLGHSGIGITANLYQHVQ